MSIKCVGWVLEHSETRLSDRLVLLALADYAHDDGGMAFPAVGTLAHKARVSKTGCRKCLRRLEEAGEIMATGITRHGTVIYSILMGRETLRGGETLPGGRETLLGGEVNSTAKPLVEPSVTVKGENAGEREREIEPLVKVGGRTTNKELWALTAGVLGEYNRLAGSKLRLLTSAGKPSQAATRIYSRVVDYPDITLDEHADIIERTLASRWWGNTSPSIGVVYGPKVFEDNIARPGISGTVSARAGKQDRDKKRLGALARIMDGDNS